MEAVIKMPTFAIKNKTDPKICGARRKTSLRLSALDPAGPIESPAIRRATGCACDGGCPKCQSRPPLQAKLKIGQPNDIYEQEADQVADQVMRMPEPMVQRKPG